MLKPPWIQFLDPSLLMGPKFNQNFTKIDKNQSPFLMYIPLKLFEWHFCQSHLRSKGQIGLHEIYSFSK